jgi:hypothetical protein
MPPHRGRGPGAPPHFPPFFFPRSPCSAMRRASMKWSSVWPCPPSRMRSTRLAPNPPSAPPSSAYKNHRGHRTPTLASLGIFPRSAVADVRGRRRGGVGDGEPSVEVSFAVAAGAVREEGAGPAVAAQLCYPYFLCSAAPCCLHRVEPSSPTPSPYVPPWTVGENHNTPSVAPGRRAMDAVGLVCHLVALSTPRRCARRW